LFLHAGVTGALGCCVARVCQVRQLVTSRFASGPSEEGGVFTRLSVPRTSVVEPASAVDEARGEDKSQKPRKARQRSAPAGSLGADAAALARDSALDDTKAVEVQARARGHAPCSPTRVRRPAPVIPACRQAGGVGHACPEQSRGRLSSVGTVGWVGGGGWGVGGGGWGVGGGGWGVGGGGWGVGGGGGGIGLDLPCFAVPGRQNLLVGCLGDCVCVCV
jgi:hypothetical protein